MERFKDKIVVITGAGSGIGRSTALRLDSEGATCIIVDINESQLEETLAMMSNSKSSSKVLDRPPPQLHHRQAPAHEHKLAGCCPALGRLYPHSKT